MRQAASFTLPPQNVAVAAGSIRAEADELSRRAEERIRAWSHWWKLCRDEAVWTDREKRSAMYRARWQYHEAVFAWLKACQAVETA